jgi:hypothetical protein
LTRGLFTIVDAADFDWLNEHKWQARPHHCGKTYYAMRPNRSGVGPSTVVMHAEICGPRADHINLCGWDNRRKNLRPSNRSTNGANCRPRSGRKYKGVYRKARCTESYESAITVNRVRYYLGTYRQVEPAARAYDIAASHCFGEFARLNFPDEQLWRSLEDRVLALVGLSR